MKLIDTEAHKDEVKEALGTDSFRLLMRAFFFRKWFALSLSVF